MSLSYLSKPNTTDSDQQTDSRRSVKTQRVKTLHARTRNKTAFVFTTTTILVGRRNGGTEL